jgi:outer membrane protein OmpA-like peptidoglycan-associated protein
MRKLTTCLLAVVAGAFLAAGTGCSDTKIIAQRDGLAAQNRELATQLKAESDARAAAEARASAHDTVLSAAPTDTVAAPDMSGPLVLSSGPRAAKPVTSGKPSTPVKATTRVTIPGQVLFASGKTTLDAAATKTLDTMAATIKSKYSGQKLVIEGFTDSTPPSKTSVWKSNDEIAQARATAVKTYLVKKGVAAADITVKAMGTVEPASTKNPALNRRVEVAVLAAK